jgi:hypothetical protein
VTAPASLIDPQPGAYLTVTQSQRIECLRVAFELCAGRAVNHAVVFAIARWLFNNEDVS